ncbi:MAG: lamin tail domain-containing protein [Kofleriaceae bacterium]|nr:lamin tail domain-containing protein [Kofleriaceae bacterium]MCB9571360.1 lamin tail domain-containing protein [Kofleriaceae bacterium]
MTKPLRDTLVAALIAVAPVAAGCGPGGDDTSAACANILPGDVVVSEIFADYAAPPGGSGADDGKEWFELYNASGGALDLEGLTIIHSRPDGSSEKTHVMAPVTIDAGGYLVLGNVLPDFVTGYLDYGYGADLGDLFNSDGGRIAVTCGGAVIDEALYDVVDAGLATGFDGGGAPDYTANDDLANWCTPPEEAAYEYVPANFGTPGTANYDCAGTSNGMCDDGGTPRATVPPTAGQLVITEVHPNPSGDDNLQEWFEAYATADVDLNGIQLDRAGDTRSPDVVNADACLHVAAGTYVVFGKNPDPLMNGTLPRVDGIFKFSMVDSGDVQILDPMGGVIDAVTWTNASNDKSRQLDPDVLDATANDTEGAWCDATVAWAGADKGSPGAVNEQCPPPSGMCIDPDDGQTRAVVHPTAGQLTIDEWMPNPALVGDTAGEWFELHASADFDLNDLQAGATALGATPIVTSAMCLQVTAGSYIVFGRNPDPGANGMLPAVAGTFGFGLTNSNAQLRVGVGDVELSAVSWASSVSGVSIMLDSDGTQCNAPAGVASYNGTDVGTPGAINTPPECP